MESILVTLGLSLLFFFVSALINYYCRYLEDNNRRPILQKVLTIVVILFFLPSLPASVILFPVGTLYTKRAVRLDRAEEATRQQRIYDMLEPHKDGYSDGFLEGTNH